MNGVCVYKNSTEARIINGNWSKWGEFTECSRSCGGGIRKRFRTCDDPMLDLIIFFFENQFCLKF